MNKLVHALIQKEYDKKRQMAFYDAELRKKEVKQLLPELVDIEKKIKDLGIESSRMILQKNTLDPDFINKLDDDIANLKIKKELLLRKNGFEISYLEPYHECAKCNDTGFINIDLISKRCSCYEQKLIDFSYEKSNLNLLTEDSFDNFDINLFTNQASTERYGVNISPRTNITGLKEKAFLFIEKFQDKDTKNLFFTGRPGVGKTFMSNCIAKEILSMGKTVFYQSAPKLFEIISSYRTNNFNFNNNSTNKFSDYNYILDADLLIIDDLGIEPPSKARYAELLTILNARKSKNLTEPCKTIISTNCGLEQIHIFYTERVVSRILGDFEMLKFIGEDLRRPK